MEIERSDEKTRVKTGFHGLKPMEIEGRKINKNGHHHLHTIFEFCCE
jgi:hypothetical protein